MYDRMKRIFLSHHTSTRTRRARGEEERRGGSVSRTHSLSSPRISTKGTSFPHLLSQIRKSIQAKLLTALIDVRALRAHMAHVDHRAHHGWV
jgi:hypothetical protein